VRERGTQSRRSRGEDDPRNRSGGAGTARGGDRFWQVIAIVAIVVATVGWTTVALLAMRDPATAVAPSPTPSPTATDPLLEDPDLDPDIDPDVELSHEVPDLETLLPATWEATTFEIQSWTGATILAEDDWSAALLSFLTHVSKTPADLQVAQAYDPDGESELVIGVFRVEGIESGPLREAMLAAWRADFPDLVVSEETLGGQPVTKGVFAEGAITSWWYQRNGAVFDIETTDEALAAAIIAALP
jgi:hypothetical protein